MPPKISSIKKNNKKSQHSSTPKPTPQATIHKYCPALIEKQPKDTAGVITSYLEAKDLKSVSMVNRNSHTLFKELYKTKELLQAVIYGDLKKAEMIIHSNPALLLQKGTVTDYSGRTHFNRTALQLALGALDYNVKGRDNTIVVDGMVEMIEKHFSKLQSEDINQIIQSQYNGQFPEDNEILEAKRVSDDSAALREIINAINDSKDENCSATWATEAKIRSISREEKSERADELRNMLQSIVKAPSAELFTISFEMLTDYVIKHITPDKEFNFNLLKALYHFRNHLEPKNPQTTGKHFNHSLLTEAAKSYNQNFRLFGGYWDSPKNLFYWRKIFGYIERFVPACDAQSIAQGLHYILNDNIKSNRSLRMQDSFTPGEVYFPLDQSGIELGHNLGLSSAKCLTTNDMEAIFTKFCNSKTDSAINYAKTKPATKSYDLKL